MDQNRDSNGRFKKGCKPWSTGRKFERKLQLGRVERFSLIGLGN